MTKIYVANEDRNGKLEMLEVEARETEKLVIIHYRDSPAFKYRVRIPKGEVSWTPLEAAQAALERLEKDEADAQQKYQRLMAQRKAAQKMVEQYSDPSPA